VLLTTHPLLVPRSWRPSGPHRACKGITFTFCPGHKPNLVALLNDTLCSSNKLFSVEHAASLIVLIDIMGTRNSRTVGCRSSVRTSLLLVRKESSTTDLLYTCSNSKHPFILSYIYQHLHTVRNKAYLSLRKLLHVSAPHQGAIPRALQINTGV